jgi:hypothetical protein
VVRVVILASVAVMCGCSTLLGLGDYHEVPAGDGSCGDAQSNAQLLNACTSAQCVPFDETRVTKQLLDGALPSAPPGSGGH